MSAIRRKTFIYKKENGFQGSLHNPAARPDPVLQIGSRLMVTGICSVGLDQNGKPNGFSIRLRSPDIAVCSARPGNAGSRLAGAGLTLAFWSRLDASLKRACCNRRKPFGDADVLEAASRFIRECDRHPLHA